MRCGAAAIYGIYVPVRAHLSIFCLKNVKRNAPKASLSVKFGPAGPKNQGTQPQLNTATLHGK